MKQDRRMKKPARLQLIRLAGGRIKCPYPNCGYSYLPKKKSPVECPCCKRYFAPSKEPTEAEQVVKDLLRYE